MAMSKIADSVLELIGRTPMVRLHRLPKPGGAAVVAKLESVNPGGSIKDRIALAMIEDAERRGLLKPGATSSSRRAATPASDWPWSRR